MKGIVKEDDDRIEKEVWPRRVMVPFESYQVFVTCIGFMQFLRMMRQYKVVGGRSGEEGRYETLLDVRNRGQIVDVEVGFTPNGAADKFQSDTHKEVRDLSILF